MIVQVIVVVTAALVVATAIHLAAPAPARMAATRYEPVPAGKLAAPVPEVPVLEVSVLGQVRATRQGEELRLSDRLLEALAFLAVHPGGVTESEVRTVLWADRPSNPGSLRNLLWQLRRQVGPAEDGQPLVAFADDHGKYRLHARANCDLLRLADVTGARELHDLLLGARGRPFEARRGFEWAHAEGLAAWAEARVVALAEEFGLTAIRDGDDQGAVALAVGALVVVPPDQRLHRLVLRAHASLGDRSGVERAIDRLLASVAGSDVTDAWEAIDPETVTTYLEAGGRRGPATSLGGS
jgi:hypothetical protein